MVNKDLSVRFSDDLYATRQEVSKALGTSLIDSIWKNILSYREKYLQSVLMCDLSKSNYNICLLDSIKNKTRLLDNKFSKCMIDINRIKLDSFQEFALEKNIYTKVLKSIATNLNIDINDVAIEHIINGENVDEQYNHVIRYYKCLEFIEKNYNSEINEDLFANLYSILTGNDELTNLYREEDLGQNSSNYVINREYFCAPYNTIEFLMNNLVEYINSANEDWIIKVLTIYYQFNYIKPLSKFNDEMAILILKSLICSRRGDGNAILFPFELILQNKENYKNYIKETQKTRDLTYAISHYIEYFQECCEIMSDSIVKENLKVVNKIYVSGDNAENYKNEFGIEMNDVLPSKKIRKEKNDKTKEETKEVRLETKTVGKTVDEKQLLAMQEELLECDPLLKKSQAHFYVRHCTIGRYYTINQFKKEEKCVYETARTSMDNLAKRGYYRRENIKNKFVYTPVKIR